MTKKEILKRFKGVIIKNVVMRIVENEEEPTEMEAYLMGYIDALFDTKTIDYELAQNLCDYVCEQIAEAVKINLLIEEDKNPFEEMD